MSATGLVLVYSLNTWLPELMLRAGYNAKGSLSFLLVLNGGAVIGALIGSRVADRFGPKPVVAGCFLLGAIAITLLTVSLPLALLLLFVAVAGLGTSGTQTLIYGFVANYYRTNVRGAGVAWCAGFGRLGGVGGPVIGGLLIGAGLSTNAIFWVLAALGVLGVLLTLLVPAAHRALRSTADRTDPRGRPGRRNPHADQETSHVRPDAGGHRRVTRLARQLAEPHRAVRPDGRLRGAPAARGPRTHHPGRHQRRRPGSGSGWPRTTWTSGSGRWCRTRWTPWPRRASRCTAS